MDMETCIRKSIEQYKQILEHAGQLDQLLLKSDPEKLQSYTERLQELQDEAALNDRVFLEIFPHTSTYWQGHPLFLERTRLLEKIVELNHLLLPRIRAMMAVTANELSQLKSGRVAVAGYHQAPAQRKQFARGVG